MVDDLICISECGHRTAMMNAYINFKTNSKKLQFSVHKCKKLHVGQVQMKHKCQDLSVDRWTEVQVENDITRDIEMMDCYDGEEIMEEKEDITLLVPIANLQEDFDILTEIKEPASFAKTQCNPTISKLVVIACSILSIYCNIL